jgi:histone H4
MIKLEPTAASTAPAPAIVVKMKPLAAPAIVVKMKPLAAATAPLAAPATVVKMKPLALAASTAPLAAPAIVVQLEPAAAATAPAPIIVVKMKPLAAATTAPAPAIMVKLAVEPAALAAAQATVTAPAPGPPALAPPAPPLAAPVRANTQRHYRKVFRDSVQRITKAEIRRLARRGGVMRIHEGVYEHMRGELKMFLEHVICQATQYTSFRRRWTITKLDVMYALKSLGYKTLY